MLDTAAELKCVNLQNNFVVLENLEEEERDMETHQVGLVNSSKTVQETHVEYLH